MRTHHKPLDRGFVLWQPAWDWLQLANVRCYDGCVAISGEWFAFVGRRMEEDLQLGEELAGAPGPAALWSAYRKFWQKAFEDYRRECLALGELYATMVTPARGLRRRLRNVPFSRPKRLRALERRPPCAVRRVTTETGNRRCPRLLAIA